MGPLNESEGMEYFFTIVNISTRWSEAVPLPDSTSKTCARALIHQWIFCFGVPDNIISDRGPQFTSHLWSEIRYEAMVVVDHAKEVLKAGLGGGYMEVVHCLDPGHKGDDA